MTPTYNKVHNRFRFNGLHFSHNDLKEVAYSLIKEGEDYERITGNFLIDWLNNNDHLIVNTSGSTGTPKSIKIKKQAMVNSAISTGDFFGLKPGDTALHCLPSQYIAGKMMLVRAMILGLEIDTIVPSTRIIYNHKKRYDFCAMVPLQLENIISESRNIKKIIIGGTSVGKSLLDKIKNCNSKFYETYGMTETVTHVAIKQLHSKSGTGENYFKALPNVLFEKNEHNCLIIHAPKLVNQPLITNDVIDLKSNTSFKLLGRYDNVINSGGIKLFPEQIELKLQSIIKERFIIASENDDSLGEKLILLVEKPSSSIDDIMSSIQKLATLDKFEIPKKIYALDTFLETNSGKIQRKKTVEAALHR